MSHFTVLVTGDDVDKALAPFEESPNEDSPYRVFQDMTDEWKEEYGTKTVTRYKAPDGKLYEPWDNRFRVVTGDAFRSIGYGSDTHQKPEDHEEVEVPVKKVFKSFKAYCTEYHGGTAKGRRYGYYGGGEPKWDWYSVGGRWTGFFKPVKNPKYPSDIRLGESGAFGNLPEGGFVDSIRKCDVDFAGMRKDAEKKAAETFDKFTKLMEGVEPPSKPWDEFRKDFVTIDDARDAWHNTEWAKRLNSEAARDLVGFFTDAVEEFFVGKPDARLRYIRQAGNRAFSTFAFLHAGEWVEKGDMGWWGMSNDHMTEEEWLQKFNDFVMGLPDSTLLTVVDCHI